MKNLIKQSTTIHGASGNQLVSTLLILFFLCSWNPIKAQQQTYKVIARIANVTAANQAHLLYYKGSNDPVYATAKLENGEYIFSGVAAEPFTAFFFLDDKGIGYTDGKFQDRLELRLENGLTKITASDSVKYAKVNGGTYNKDFQQYKDFMFKEKNNLETLAALAAIGYQQKLPKAQLDELQQKIMTSYNGYEKRSLEYVKKFPDSYSGAYALKSVMGSKPNVALLLPLYEGMTAKVKASPDGKKVYEMLTAAQQTKVGSMAPLFTQPDTAGKPVSLKDFRGKYLLLDMWASWCGPCRAENPNYIANYKKYHDKGLEFLGVSLDKEGDKDKWLAAIHKDGLIWPQVSDLKYWNGEVAKLYGVRSIPQNFLIDPQGKIIAINLRGDELGKKLAELFSM